MIRGSAIFYKYDFTNNPPKVIFKDVRLTDDTVIAEAYCDPRDIIDYIGNIICLSTVEFTCESIEDTILKKICITNVINNL